ncbi:MAG: hypothetical protein HYY00_00010 [Chloroflexi bacterium]|nr:hypothetical protein [Chloroflexota bacterium]
MAVEFWGAFGPAVSVSLTPAAQGRLEVYLDGQKIFDRKEEGGKYPGLDRVRELKKLIKERVEVASAT